MPCLKLLCFAVLLWADNAIAASYTQLQSECAERMADNPPQIVVEYRFGKLKIDSSKNVEELTTLAHEINPTAKTEVNMQGLTGLKFATTLNIETLAEEIGTNDVCIIPQTVHLQLYYENPTIYLVNTLQPQTCRYNLVLRHEYTHLDIGHTALLELAPRLKQCLTDVIAERGSKVVLKSIYLQDSQAIMQKMIQEIETGLKPLVSLYKKKLLAEQSQLDTPENYQRETALCP